MRDSRMVNSKRIAYVILFLMLAGWTGILCFYHLGEAGTYNWDEARHMVNAYEMMSSDNWWIHTYLGETDYYNFKPPLSMWCIMLCCRLFGVSSYTMRLYSAIATMLLFVVLQLFVAGNFGRRAAIISGLVFVSGTDLFFFHMARSADADALYLLCFSAAMVCLYRSEKNPWLLSFFSFFLSLAFLAKCLHVALGVAIFLCYLPRLYKRLKIKHYAAAILGGVLPAGVWAVARFSYDRFAFFVGMFGQEVVDRVEKENDHLGYLRYFGQNPVIMISLAAALAGVLLLKMDKGKPKNNLKTLIGRLIFHDLYLFFLWLLIPLLVYSASGAFMEWYGYICYLPFCVIIGVTLGRVSAVLGRRRYAAGALLLLPVIGLGISVKESVWNLNTLRYQNNTDIRHDLAELIERYPEYIGAEAYIENSRNEYQGQNIWEQNNIADAYIEGGLRPINGGVPLFLDDQDAILIISKDLFETYRDSLAGRVVLVDGNDYLIFSNEFYG